MAPERTEQKMRRAIQYSFGKEEAETKERGKRKLLRDFATEDGNSNSGEDDDVNTISLRAER